MRAEKLRLSGAPNEAGYLDLFIWYRNASVRLAISLYFYKQSDLVSFHCMVHLHWTYFSGIEVSEARRWRKLSVLPLAPDFGHFRLSHAAFFRCLFCRPEGTAGKEHRIESLHLLAFPRRLLHFMDLLWERGKGG